MPALPPGFVVSVIVPVYNERNTLLEIVARLQATPLSIELILVNDGSTDGSAQICDELATTEGVHVIHHSENRGKGASLKSGFSQAKGNVVIVQDADLEYDPSELTKLIAPIAANRADVVYGSRYLRQSDRDADGWHYRANRAITWCSNRFTGWQLTDVETCYKAISRPFVDSIASKLCEKRFGIEIELTARLAAAGARVAEVPITYAPRSRRDGKKIGWQDGLWALWCVLRYAQVR